MNGITAENLRSHLVNNHHQIISKIVAKRPSIKPPSSAPSINMRGRESHR